MVTIWFKNINVAYPIGNKPSIKRLLKLISYSPFTLVFWFLFEILGKQSLSEGMLNGNVK
jgi:hypothetical protein